MKLVLSFSPWYIHVAEKFSLEIYNSTITHPPENFECEKHTPNHQLFNSIQRISLMIKKNLNTLSLRIKTVDPLASLHYLVQVMYLVIDFSLVSLVTIIQVITYSQSEKTNMDYMWWYFVHIDLVWYIWTCTFWHNFFFLNNVLLKTKRQMKNQRTQSIKYGLVQKIDYNFIIIIMQLQ